MERVAFCYSYYCRGPKPVVAQCLSWPYALCLITVVALCLFYAMWLRGMLHVCLQCAHIPSAPFPPVLPTCSGLLTEAACPPLPCPPRAPAPSPVLSVGVGVMMANQGVSLDVFAATETFLKVTAWLASWTLNVRVLGVWVLVTGCMGTGCVGTGYWMCRYRECGYWVLDVRVLGVWVPGTG